MYFHIKWWLKQWGKQYEKIIFMGTLYIVLGQ